MDESYVFGLNMDMKSGNKVSIKGVCSCCVVVSEESDVVGNY